MSAHRECRCLDRFSGEGGLERRSVNDGTPVHSVQTLLEELSTIVRDTCQARGDTRPASPTFQMITTPNVTQRRAIELL